ncbi:hypothetical protein ACF8MD_11485 [Pseudomonas sp. zjy_8]
MVTEVRENFKRLTEISASLSIYFENVDCSCRRRKFSTYYLAKMVHASWALEKLLPETHTDYLDFSSVASICRNIIELCNLCWYFCFDEVDDSEVDFRFLLYDYHQASSFAIICDKLSLNADDAGSVMAERQELRASVISHCVYEALAENEKEKVRKGKKDCLLNHNEIAKVRSIDVRFFEGMYKLMSVHTHSSPSSINSFLYARTHSPDMDRAFYGLAVNYASGFIAQMLLDVGDMWGIEFAKSESESFVRFYAAQLYD